MFIFIVLRVAFIQLVSYEKLSYLASDLWSRDLPIEADRGLILDRNGVVLADNLTTTSLVLIPNQIKDKDDTSSKLASILNVSKDSPLFIYLAKIQEEVHRYAITYHRNLRSQGLFASYLDMVEGIGEVRKKELLKKYGSLKKIKEASLTSLEEILPKDVAENLYNVLRNEEKENE